MEHPSHPDALDGRRPGWRRVDGPAGAGEERPRASGEGLHELERRAKRSALRALRGKVRLTSIFARHAAEVATPWRGSTFRGRGARATAVDRLLEADELAVCGAVITELLRGLRSVIQRREVMSLLGGRHHLVQPADL